jgi:hypothetical protein
MNIPLAPPPPASYAGLDTSTHRELNPDGSIPSTIDNVVLERFNEDSGFKFNEFLLQLIYNLQNMEWAINRLMWHATLSSEFMEAVRDELEVLDGINDRIDPISKMYDEEMARREQVAKRLKSAGFSGMAEFVAAERKETGVEEVECKNEH